MSSKLNNSPLDPDRLYNLLPAYVRKRDQEDGQCALQAFLRVVSRQANLLQFDIAQLYDNWFIETCQDWVLPYLGDLIGHRRLLPIGPFGDEKPGSREALLRERTIVSRREVANTLRDRRRRGTRSVLEQLAGDITDWPAHAIDNTNDIARPSATVTLNIWRQFSIPVTKVQARCLDAVGPHCYSFHFLKFRVSSFEFRVSNQDP